MPKNIAIWLKQLCNLHELASHSNSNGFAFCIKSRHMMNEITNKRDRNEGIKAIKRLCIGT